MKWSDVRAAKVEWELTFQGMTDGERQILEGFFEQMQGRLQDFAFLDPTANLLKWSEALGTPAWQQDAFVSVTGGINDSLGGTRASAVRNAGAAPARIQQTLEVPSWYQYAVSAYLRSESRAGIALFASAGANEATTSFEVGATWRRFCILAQPGGGEETVRFGVQLPAGGTAEVFGLQVEAQPRASNYKKSTSRGGIYPNSRFVDDVLEISATGPGEHSGTVRIASLAG